MQDSFISYSAYKFGIFFCSGGVDGRLVRGDLRYKVRVVSFLEIVSRWRTHLPMTSIAGRPADLAFCWSTLKEREGFAPQVVHLGVAVCVVFRGVATTTNREAALDLRAEMWAVPLAGIHLISNR